MQETKNMFVEVEETSVSGKGGSTNHRFVV